MFYCTKHVRVTRLSTRQMKRRGGAVWILSVLSFAGPRVIISLYFRKRRKYETECEILHVTIRVLHPRLPPQPTDEAVISHRPPPKMKRISLNVLLVLACFVCTCIMVVLQYRNLLLLCGGISKPVVHCSSLIYSLLHCSLCVCSVCELSPPLPSDLSVHGVTTTGIEWSAAFKTLTSGFEEPL